VERSVYNGSMLNKNENINTKKGFIDNNFLFNSASGTPHKKLNFYENNSFVSRKTKITIP
jgi:hypothetical protein